jgi:hypothetical protein
MYKRRKAIEEEYFVNGTKLKKLYYMYVHQTKWERAVDYLVFFAVFFTIVSLFLEYIEGVDELVIHYIHVFSVVVVFIFALELFISYLKSKTKRHFFRKHWLDFILITFLSVYFLFTPYFALSRFENLLKIKEFAERIKRLKIFFSTILEKLNIKKE